MSEGSEPRTFHSVKRALNAADGIAGLPPLIVCPRCDGQAFDRDSCGLCGNCGYLLEDGAVRPSFVDMVQILARFAQATGIKLAGTAEYENQEHGWYALVPKDSQ